MYCRETPLGCVLFFGRFELEIRVDYGRRWALWSLVDGTPLAISGWGVA
jgi:hypothetical protein